MMKFILGAMALVVIGCSSSQDDGLTEKDKQAADRVQQLAQSSGGDWSKLSEADRKYLVDLSFGSEQSAKMLLMSKAGALWGNPGGGPEKPK